MSGRYEWDVGCSDRALRTKNIIRNVVEDLHLEPNPDKKFIPLSIGDPSVFGNLNPSQVVIDAVVETVKSLKYHGYAHSVGHEVAREAVAKYSSTDHVSYTAQDIILVAGCSGGLSSCISCLANPGQNILLPKPGFPIYRTIADQLGVHVKYYNLEPTKGWEINLKQMEEQIDNNTVAIIINNPSNPCGSVFSRQHLMDILTIARNNYLPIIADEVYEYMVFEGQTFIPLAELSKDVPILTCCSISKRQLVPGWRTGWIKIHDPLDIFKKKVRLGLNSLNQETLGCNTITQGALPKILSEIPRSTYIKTNNMIERHAHLVYKELKHVKGLNPIMPQGAMYMMVEVDFSHLPAFVTEIQFIEQLVKEESVFCLPGLCFNYPGYLRLVLTVPEDLMMDACQRIKEFCTRYYVDNIKANVSELKKNIHIKSDNIIMMNKKNQMVKN